MNSVILEQFKRGSNKWLISAAAAAAQIASSRVVYIKVQ